MCDTGGLESYKEIENLQKPCFLFKHEKELFETKIISMTFYDRGYELANKTEKLERNDQETMVDNKNGIGRCKTKS